MLLYRCHVQTVDYSTRKSDGCGTPKRPQFPPEVFLAVGKWSHRDEKKKNVE